MSSVEKVTLLLILNHEGVVRRDSDFHLLTCDLWLAQLLLMLHLRLELEACKQRALDPVSTLQDKPLHGLNIKGNMQRLSDSCNPLLCADILQIPPVLQLQVSQLFSERYLRGDHAPST